MPMMIPTTPQAMATGFAPLIEPLMIFTIFSLFSLFFAENMVHTIAIRIDEIPDFVTDIFNTLMEIIRYTSGRIRYTVFPSSFQVGSSSSGTPEM